MSSKKKQISLLIKSQLEMHAAVPSGGRSPRTSNGASTPQLKPSTDTVQNSSSSQPSQLKGKKRERGDQGSDPIKRERSSKFDDGHSGHLRSENMLKLELAKITDNGGLVDNEGVEKLVQLMQTDRAEGKLDLASRVILADVIAATDRFECLGQFVQLRGLSVLDEWLQEVHNGKIGDINGPKDVEKSVEDFLLSLLRALDKLPVNLNALRTWPLGKSVNHLRSHKNVEIQKKARGLVDTWKKRVEVEMQISDEKSGLTQVVSWPSKVGVVEVSHGGNRHMAASSDIPGKSSNIQPSALKTASGKLVHGEGIAKSASTPGSGKLSTLPAMIGVSLKDSHCRLGVSSAMSDVPLTTLKGEKSSSSSQSQNNSQSCSSDHVKPVASAWKEDARSSTAGSPNMGKISSGASRHRRSSHVSQGSALSGPLKENALGKLRPSNRNAKFEKISQSGSTSERALDVPVSDLGNSHRLIVRLPNPGRSPARSANSFDDPSVMVSRASSPGISEKHDRKVKGKIDPSRPNIAEVNTESWQSNDVKEGFTGSEEGDGSPGTIADEMRCRDGEEIGKLREAARATCSSSANNTERFPSETKSAKLCDATLSSITALIESCVKYSKANPDAPVGDDGMNLLASVAAGEMSKSDLGSPIASPGANSPVPQDSSMHNDSASRLSREEALSHQGPSDDCTETNAAQDNNLNGSSCVQDKLHADTAVDDNKATSSTFDEKSVTGASVVDLKQKLESYSNSDMKTDDATSSAPLVMPSLGNTEESGESEGDSQLGGERMVLGGSGSNDGQDFKLKGKSPVIDKTKKLDGLNERVDECNSTTAPDFIYDSAVHAHKTKNVSSGLDCKKESVEESAPSPSLEMGGENKRPAPGLLNSGDLAKQKLAISVLNHVDPVDESSENIVKPAGSDEIVSETVVTMEAKNHAKQWDKKKVEQVCDAHSALDGQVGVASIVSSLKDDSSKTDAEIKEAIESRGAAPDEDSPSNSIEQAKKCMKSGFKSSHVETEDREECSSSAEASSLPGTVGSNTAAKLDFDLNEGFTIDEGNQGEVVTPVVTECVSAVHLSSPLPFPVSSTSSSLPASITVAAAAKGPFVPPENLLKSKGELGWKGSAATSAFRPAEPRKALEMPLGTIDTPPDEASVSKQVRAPLDIDLNVPDDRVLEDIASRSSPQETIRISRSNSRCYLGHSEMFNSDSVPARGAAGLDLDLNKNEEDNDVAQLSVSAIRKLDRPVLPVKSLSSTGGFLNGEVNVLRDFDLNNGPALDEVASEPIQYAQQSKNDFPYFPPVAGLKFGARDIGSASSWLPGGARDSYPTIIAPAMLPDRGDQPFPIVVNAGMQRILGPPAGSTSLGPDLFRGPVLSSSPAMAFSSTTPLSYPGFPFSSSFPIPSTSFPGVSTTFMESSSGGGLGFPATHSQFVGPVAMPTHYPRPYVISIPDGPSSTESSRKWMMPGLDLNSGPGGSDVDGKDERFTSVSRQFSVPASHAPLTEEQVRMFQATGGILKRKEPEGGWDAHRYSYRQPSWQ
ncbi:hypothetical protein Syun_023997 [Stephania yunnanensis]|uniref:TFIIS N-terminal domain-containing protein n=1 Tax=Stephania yunnanensis TaxID=152371 RepID=A0AAP0I3M8_9MAGN